MEQAFVHISTLLQNKTNNPVEEPQQKNIIAKPRVQDEIAVPSLPAMPKFPSVYYLSSTAGCKYNFKEFLNHIYDSDGNKLNIDKLITNPTTSPIWIKSLENELGRLSQGFQDRVTPQDALDFISFDEVPRDRKVTYANFVCDYRPLKTEKFRVRMTIGGDKLDYHEDTASPTASLFETKLLINSVISDHKRYNSKFCSINIKDFFLTTPMDRPEYLRIHKKYFSNSFKNLYNLNKKIHHDGFIYCKVKKGLYGLK